MKHTHIIPTAVLTAVILAASCQKSNPDNPPTPTVYPYASVASDNSNIPCGGTISTQYSDSPYGSDISKLVDGDVTTSFVTSHNEFYVLWSGSKSFALKSYALVSSDSDASYDPADWVLSGSTDNKTWTQIDKRSKQTFSGRNTKNEYNLNTPSAYKFYRLTFSANKGGANTAIAELILTDGTAMDINDLMQFSNGDTHSTSTPMGQFYQNRHKTTSSDIEWLANPENEPTTTTSATGLSWSSRDVTLYPYGSPVPADINQHVIGNCSACASWASMAYIYPEFIKSIITDNGDKTYTVKMFDPQGERVYVTISSNFLVDGNMHLGQVSGKNDVACWSTVLEKALMKWNTIYHCSEVLDGIGTEHVTPPFVGNGDSFAFAPGVLGYDDMERAVTVLLNRGWFVVGGFSQSDRIIGDSPYKTVSGHAFTFLFTESTSAVYGMRNPWGFCNGRSPSDPEDGVAPIPNDGRTQPMIDLRVCAPGEAASYKQKVLLPYNPPRW